LLASLAVIAPWEPLASSHSSPLGLVLASLVRFDRSLEDDEHVHWLLLSTAAVRSLPE
jgi:hypothetical protein